MSRAIVLIDTGVFDELLGIPGWANNQAGTIEQAKAWIEQGAELLLPMATIIETGNHVAQAKGDRHAVAQRYVEQVRAALTGESPFTPTGSLDPRQVLLWLEEFPKYAVQGIGAADQSIIDEWRRQKRASPHRRVLIWTTDADLSGYDE